jgi:hypothetical protein
MCSDESLDQLLHHFWETEEMHSEPRIKDEMEGEQNFVENTTREYRKICNLSHSLLRFKPL